MFGWEYPPVKSGGLGTACYGLTKAMAELGAEITLVVPKAINSEFSTHLNLTDGKNLKIKNNFIKFYEINSLLDAYINEEIYEEKYSQWADILKEDEAEEKKENNSSVYGKNLFQEVARFARRAAAVAMQEDFDLIVCHDWMTVDAGLLAKSISGKPLSMHIHATEFDRTGGNPNQRIYDIEKRGLEQADQIIANSFITRENCINHFNISPEKIVPVHLAIDQENYDKKNQPLQREKYVLFLARMTIQKGPEYFLKAAQLALKFDPNIRFIMAGSGHDLPRMIHLAADLGISHKVAFTGALNSKKAREAYRIADLFVMTSVAEPFGLTILEAVRSGIPCIAPKTAGISEIMTHIIKVDFWDIYDLANNIVSVLKYPVLHEELKNNSYQESNSITWKKTAQKTMDAYKKIARKEVSAYAQY